MLRAMATLFNPRHETFVRHWLKTGNGAQSYLAAGYKPTTRNALDVSASQLLRRPKIKARINEVRRQMSYKTRVTLETLVEQAEDARRLAMATEQPGAAIQATTLQAKLVGLLVERKESGQPGDFAQLETTEAILAKVRAEFGEAEAQALATILNKVACTSAVPPASLVTALSCEISGLPN
jgi:phage terminase small subunit